MLAVLAAVTMSAASPAPQPFTLAQASPQAVASTFTRPLATPRRCKDARGVQTASPDPALLFRDQDRLRGQARKLIDLPDGERCLLGGVEPPGGR